MTDDELKAIEELAEKATPGPWRVDGTKALGAYGVWTDYGTHPGDVPGELYPDQVCSVFPYNRSDVPQSRRNANAAFIAAAISDVPRLVAEVRRLRAERDRLLVDYARCELSLDDHVERAFRLTAGERQRFEAIVAGKPLAEGAET